MAGPPFHFPGWLVQQPWEGEAQVSSLWPPFYWLRDVGQQGRAVTQTQSLLSQHFPGHGLLGWGGALHSPWVLAAARGLGGGGTTTC